MTLEFYEPETVEEAVSLAARFGADGRFIAGGTDLVIQMHRGRRAPERLISILRLGELGQIHADEGRITIGALVPHRDLERHEAFQGNLRAVVEAAEVIGGHQVRNAGTVGGNICNASPAADLLPVLLALDASVHLRSDAGAREMALQEFLLGPGRTAAADGELLTAVSFERPPRAGGTAFLKFGRRQAMEISIVSSAAMVALDDQGLCAHAKIAVGAASPTAVRVPMAEDLLVGRSLSTEALCAAGEAAAAACAPLTDVRASAGYRRGLVQVMVERAVRRAAERAETRKS